MFLWDEILDTYLKNFYVEIIMKIRGQVTIFVIVAILFVAAIVLFFLFHPHYFSRAETINPEVQPVYDYVADCIRQTAHSGLYAIGAKGGYYFPSKTSRDTGEAYYVVDKKSFIPSRQTIESQLGAYITVNVRSCIAGFKEFPAFNISSGEVSTKTTLEKDEFLVNVKYPITFKKGDSTYTLSEFKNIKVITRVDLLYTIASNYSALFLKTNGLSLTYASDVENSSNIITTFRHFPGETLVTLTDSKGIDGNSTYQWSFALR